MPRQLRIQYPGALYHVTARGDRREDIVHDDGDREMLLATLAEACKKAGWEVLAWVIIEAAARSCERGYEAAARSCERGYEAAARSCERGYEAVAGVHCIVRISIVHHCRL
jgi:hypothetical protein